MNPPWSMILFTTLAGAAQGLLLVLFGADVGARAGVLPPLPWAWVPAGALVVLLLSLAGLVAASFHLGHPLRAWRAAAMWRTSWLSREVIVLPLFMAATLAWALSSWQGRPHLGLGLLAVVLALLLYLCTGMIYGAVRAIREWHTPMTPLNFALLGLASGLLLAAALAAWLAPVLVRALSVAALAAALVAAAARIATWRHHARRAAKTTLQTAIGVRHPRIVPLADGAMGGTFNTREFQHGRPDATLRRARAAALLLGLLPPWGALVAASAPAGVLALLWLLQWAGLLAERWCFFTDARHPQNLYHRPASAR